MAVLPDAPSTIGLVVILAGTAFVALGKWPKAYTLAILVLLVQGLQIALAGGLLPLAFTRAGFLAGAWWSPLSYMYLHAGWGHLIGNLFVLLTAGPALEDRVGAKVFTATYFAAGLAAAGAHVALVSLGLITDLPAVGASGAIFGVLTVLAVRYPRERIPMPIPGLGLMLGMFRFTAFVVLLLHLGLNLAIMFNDVFGRGSGGVAWYGHFAGYLTGLAIGVALPKKLAIEQARVPDVAPLRPLALNPKMADMLDKAAKFTGENEHDAEFANAWVDRFLARATCPNDGAPLSRQGYEAACPKGDYRVAFPPKR